jgi:hypothetical protein
MDQKNTGDDCHGVEVVILSGACCNPSTGSMDDLAAQMVERAAEEAGVHVHVRKQSMVTALHGGVPKEVREQMKRDSQAGGLRVPVVIVNGTGVSYGVPDAAGISAAIRGLAGARATV